MQRALALAWTCCWLFGCASGGHGDTITVGTTATTTGTSVTGAEDPTSGISASASNDVTTAQDGSGESGASSTGEKLDVNEQVAGCQYVDFLFVIDNSESMATYQQALAAAFPAFVASMFDALPDAIDVHVAITTTEFDYQCDSAETTINCQTNASFDEVQSHYVTSDVDNNGGNGAQGRLFNYGGMHWFETSSDADPAPLETWFASAATAAGEDGCSFEMPVAAAGWAFDPANAAVNEGFVRDAGGLLVIFFLTDEPDKSPESETVYRDMILGAKQECGGEVCVFVAGIVPTCIVDANQKLWQFLGLWSDGDPSYGDILDTVNYGDYFGEALAGAIAQACADVPVG